MNTLSATDARNRFFELINLAMYRGEEFLVEKDGKPAMRLLPPEEKKSPEEIKATLAEFRRVFAKSAKRKYWSVLDTPAWKRKERKYLENISKGILRGSDRS
ncbi:type II toxin-antitoxin system Phd/YefM family antitoxin [Candidatus Gottesmanbacteria bacterium]|nr:type II toxin-antitoxin system Phd/YefM family antitoxin [Candidatus Gottesmanbacteria bacterium]